MGKFLTILTLSCLALCVSLTGCNSGGCTELRSAVPRADFYSSSTARPITVDSLSIVGIGAPGDSVLYGPAEKLSSVYLPMPADMNSVQWRIGYMQENLAQYNLADTVSMKFERMPWFAGEECGAMFKYKITELRYTQNLIDSVIIADSTVVNIDQANLNIYFRTE